MAESLAQSVDFCSLPVEGFFIVVVVVSFLVFSTLPFFKVNFLEPEDGLFKIRSPVFYNEPEPRGTTSWWPSSHGHWDS